jgi:5'-3' exonuclease
LVAASSRAVPITVVSTDSDFIQLLNEFENVSLYNPVKKCYVDNTDYDYVIWKSLRGDACDNVKKLKGFSDSVAEMYCRDIPRLKLFFESNKELSDQFAKNYSLIKFKTWSDEEAKKMFSSEPVRDWEKVKNVFEQMNFASMTNSKYWNRFVETFDKLWTTE